MNQDSRVYSFPRYLAAKKSVDDRALNRHVWNSLADALPRSSAESPLCALEIGAGIGTMLERMLEWGLLEYADYTALDALPENIAASRERLPAWAKERGYQATQSGDSQFSIQGQARSVRLDLKVADLFDFIAANDRRPQGLRRWDLLIAHAFLDLMDIPTTLPQLFNLLRPGGLFYFTINFDGATLFEPAIDPVFDDLIQALYHRTMDERIMDGKPSGDSRAGRHLFKRIQDAGGHILDAGASDWVVFPTPQGYPHDEAYFLHFIIHTLHQALRGHPELDTARFEEWIARRHRQIEDSLLVYIAHQLDFLGWV